MLPSPQKSRAGRRNPLPNPNSEVPTADPAALQANFRLIPQATAARDRSPPTRIVGRTIRQWRRAAFRVETQASSLPAFCCEALHRIPQYVDLVDDLIQLDREKGILADGSHGGGEGIWIERAFFQAGEMEPVDLIA